MGWGGVYVHPGDVVRDGRRKMQQIIPFVGNLITWKDSGGHSFVDYALMAIFVALSAWVVMPGGVASRARFFTREP